MWKEAKWLLPLSPPRLETQDGIILFPPFPGVCLVASDARVLSGWTAPRKLEEAPRSAFTYSRDFAPRARIIPPLTTKREPRKIEFHPSLCGRWPKAPFSAMDRLGIEVWLAGVGNLPFFALGGRPARITHSLRGGLEIEVMI